MVIRLTIVCVRHNVTMEILCHKDTECVVSDETIEIKVASDKVRNKIKEFCKFARISVKEYPIIHKLVISRESKKIFVKTFNNQQSFPIPNREQGLEGATFSIPIVITLEMEDYFTTEEIVGALVFIFLAIVPPLILEYREKHRKQY